MMGLLLCITLGTSTLAPFRRTMVILFNSGWIPRLGILAADQAARTQGCTG